MPDQDITIAAKLCNCAIDDIDHTRTDENGVLIVYFVADIPPRRFTQKQIDKLLEQDLTLVRTTLTPTAEPTIITDVHHCVQNTLPATSSSSAPPMGADIVETPEAPYAIVRKRKHPLLD